MHCLWLGKRHLKTHLRLVGAIWEISQHPVQKHLPKGRKSLPYPSTPGLIFQVVLERTDQVHSPVPKFNCCVNSYLPFKAVTNVVIVVASFFCTQLYVCMMAVLRAFELLLPSHTGRTDPYFMPLREVREGISIWETPPWATQLLMEQLMQYSE